MPEFNLPALFRYVCSLAWPKITIIIPEADKDRLIHTLTRTQFIQGNSPEKRAFIPCNMVVQNKPIEIIPSHNVPSGQMVICPG